MIVFIAVTSIGEGVNVTLLAPFVSRILRGDASAYGTILALQAVGGVGGILVAGYGHGLPIRTLVGVGSILFGALDLPVILYPLALPGLWLAGLLIARPGCPAPRLTAGTRPR